VIHDLETRIYYEDTDAGGVVYHASYLKFAERGRTEYLRECGYQNSELQEKLGVIFVVKHIDIDYLRPAFLDDLLVVQTSVTEVGNSSFTMGQDIKRKNEDICAMQVVLVTVGRDTIKPLRLPEEVKNIFQSFKKGP